MKTSTTDRLFSSSYFQIIANIFQRSIGLISTLILARLLTPEDFGVVAIIFLTLNLAEVLSDSGAQPYIVQKSDVDDVDINSAWTLNLTIKSVTAVVAVMVAPLVAEFMSNPQGALPIQVVALTIVIRAFKNPGTILLIKGLNYKPIFKLAVTQKLVSFCVVIGCAFGDLGYWAIVYGDVASSFSLLIGSYFISTYRPKLSYKNAKRQLDFTQWSFLRGIVGYIRSQIDLIVVTKSSPIEEVGAYHLQREMALTPAVSLFIPALEPFLAVVSDVRNETSTFKYRIRVSILGLIAIITPMSVFVFLESELLIAVVLGGKWVQYHGLLAVFSLMFFSYCLHALVSDFFIAAEKIKVLFYLDAMGVLILLPVLLSIHPGDMGYNIAIARAVIGLLITIATTVLLARMTSFGMSTLIKNLIPSGVTLAVTVLIYPLIKQGLVLFDLHILELVLSAVIFFLLYTGLYLGLSLVLKNILFENFLLCCALGQQMSKIFEVK